MSELAYVRKMRYNAALHRPGVSELLKRWEVWFKQDQKPKHQFFVLKIFCLPTHG